jgi:hypothetical protein
MCKGRYIRIICHRLVLEVQVLLRFHDGVLRVGVGVDSAYWSKKE